MKKWIYRSITSIIAVFLGLGCARPVDPVAGTSAEDERDDTFGQGGNGGSGISSACALDCSSISTPPCYEAICDKASGRCAVVEAPAGTPCDDGRFCTVGETCKGGSCGGGSTNDCGISRVSCTEALCDDASRTCSPGPVVDGTPCEADDLCTVHSACQGGLCIGVPRDCFFAPTPDECHVGSCNSATGQCEPVPGNDGAECTDKSDLCMASKVCSGGQCLGGKQKDCSSLTAGCLQGVCDPSSGQCSAEPVAEGMPCSEGIESCNDGICDKLGACVPVPVLDGVACEDGDACTVGETCAAGVCTGGQPAVPIEYFHETFASNAAGWTLGTEWQIGPAKASPGGVGYGAEDPVTDHTSASDDNGIAGVVIGGYPSTNPHGSYMLVSPVIPIAAGGPVYLDLWRWLNGDAAPYMVETVDVYDGAQWINLWTSGPGNKEVSWTRVTYRLTPYTNPKLQVRFGFSVGNAAYVVSGWNIDDVVIANAACN